MQLAASVGTDAAAAAPAACLPEHVELAHRLADAAAAITTRYFRTPVPVDVKLDASPVTIADRKPLFGTLIALLHRGEPVLGIIDQPILKERWVGVAGQRSTLNGQPISTRECGAVGDAYLYATTPHMFAGDTEAAFNRVRDAVRIPMYGCDCYAYGLLAAGYCDLVVEADLKPYDYMALVPVIQGAGGVVTDWRGQPLRWQGDVAACSGEVVAAGDARAHQQALELLQWKQ
ncbi:hypothetical protein CHLNCDRAFT_58575 [Chlorella variabilis]|uniref:Histidinol-phosphatase n=1 Tax=Chlorella variabilis TaxID=554065 RepID=E1ZLJ4_CHLVA|nr:hypothetical protein CHLNCDRAFT_58575 [Chlorella variabilis]EFN53278.1 hypothetical protein CHLNCDRAFT_58575 [Chlorella variabilis]|eukprot:XP_005845380.1 hypothetical protein CHLNCDRAFT_58575 [Chlorella variabilis]